MWGGEEVGSYANFARHVRSCRAGGGGVVAAGDGEVDGGGRAAGVGGEGVGDVGGGVGRRVSCQYCGRVVTIRNMARHLHQSCRVLDPRGGGGRPR